MNNEQSNFVSVHRIVCPVCNMKQTGIIKESPGVVIQIPSAYWGIEAVEINIPHGTYYILCSFIPCQELIMGDALEECTRQTVQFPSQINNNLNTKS